MWLIHVGFMSYEAGAGRRKNVMATAMKNILTIAVVTPTFYYFGWWIYGCFSTGIIPFSPGDFLEQRGRGAAGHLVVRGPDGELLLDHVSVGGQLRAEPDRPPLGRLLGRVPPLLVDDRFDPLGRAHRARAALGLPDPRLHPRLGHLDPRRLVGLERLRLPADALRIPRLDRRARRARRRGRLHPRRPPQPRPADRQVHAGRASRGPSGPTTCT